MWHSSGLSTTFPSLWRFSMRSEFLIATFIQCLPETVGVFLSMLSSGKQAPSSAAPQNAPWLHVQRKWASVISNSSWRLRLLPRFQMLYLWESSVNFANMQHAYLAYKEEERRKAMTGVCFGRLRTYNSSLSPVFRASPTRLHSPTVCDHPDVFCFLLTILLCSGGVQLCFSSKKMQSISL